MNKEQLRKELEDCWEDGYQNRMMLGGKARKKAMDTYITTRLAALDDGDDKKPKFHHPDPAIYYKEDEVDDGQEGRRWQPPTVSAIYFLLH